MTTLRPAPAFDNEISASYWEAARRHEFSIQRCGSCGTHLFPPRSNCPACGAADPAWVQVSGRGAVYTFTIARRPTHPASVDRVPYVIAVVELAEGPRLNTNIVECPPEDVHIGMPVEVTFEDATDGFVLPVFKPARERRSTDG